MRSFLADPHAPTAERTEKEQDLVNAMKQLVAKAPTPWPQMFLIRNLCDLYGFISTWKMLQVEKWILPQGVEVSQVGCFLRAWCQSRAEGSGQIPVRAPALRRRTWGCGVTRSSP